MRAEQAFSDPSLGDEVVTNLLREIIQHSFDPALVAVSRLAQWLADSLIATAGLDEQDARKKSVATFQRCLAQAMVDTPVHYSHL